MESYRKDRRSRSRSDDREQRRRHKRSRSRDSSSRERKKKDKKKHKKHHHKRSRSRSTPERRKDSEDHRRDAFDFSRNLDGSQKPNYQERMEQKRKEKEEERRGGSEILIVVWVGADGSQKTLKGTRNEKSQESKCVWVKLKTSNARLNGAQDWTPHFDRSPPAHSLRGPHLIR